MAVTYSITGGADADKFSIDATTGVVTFKAVPDFEAPGDADGDNIYELQVTATDEDGASTPQDMRVTVTDVVENTNLPPQFTSEGAVMVPEGTTAVITVVAVDPDEGEPPIEPPIEPPPGGGPLPPLVASGSITATANNQVIENKLVTGKIIVNGKSGVIIRNCQVNHPGGIGIDVTNCTNLTIEDVNVVNKNEATGINPNPDESKNIQLLYMGPITVRRVTVTGACGIYAYRMTGKLTMQFLEGHRQRGTASIHRGQLVQCNGGSGASGFTGDVLLEDFSAENPGNNSHTADNVSMFNVGSNKLIRRGLIDGNNCPAGVAIMFEDGSTDAVVEDVDAVRQGNGTFAFYDGAHRGKYVRCRMRDQVMGNQGRGKPSSDGGAGPVNLVSAPNVTGARFEANKYFNVNEANLKWCGAGTHVDLTKGDFVARAAIRNRKPGT